MKAFFARIQTRMKSLRGDEEGFVVMATLGIFLMLFVLCASIYAVGETARQKIRIQNACDAAAYSAAVVQADGLSRMASINRAMAQTYVHMTNLQMDYITYRWMRLTEKRFREDYNNAKAYHQWMITNFNPEEGWIGLIATAANAYIMRAVGAKCNLRHDKEGIGWWCGRGPNTNHNIMFNGHRVGGGTSSYEKLVQAIDKRTSFMGDGSVAGIQGKDESENDAHDRDTVDYSARQKSEQEKIDAEYEGKIRALDPEDPEYESKRAKLEHERDTKKDESNENDDDTELSTSEQNRYEAESEAQAQAQADKNRGDAADSQSTANDLYNDAKKGDSGAGSAKVSPPPLNTTWGARVAKLIDADKKTIQMLNSALSIVNSNMHKSMQDTAKFVLASMLRDPRIPPDKALRNVYAYFYIPRGINPYQVSESEREENFYSPLCNTEPCERLFLHMAKVDTVGLPLYAQFPTYGQPDGSLKGAGLDQWFIRAGKNGKSSFPTVVRTEGELGIQRAYKDANINETGAGVVLRHLAGQPWCVSRGNHIANVMLESTSQSGNKNETGENQIPKTRIVQKPAITIFKGEVKFHGYYNEEVDDNIFKKMVKSFITSLAQGIGGKLADTFCDITPSAGNASSNEIFAMCPKSSDTTALYADYDWSSAKWICMTGENVVKTWAKYLFCNLVIGKCKHAIIYCNSGSIKHKRRWVAKVRHYGKGHFHFPKWFCGEKPRYMGDTLGIGEGVAHWTFLDMVPPLAPEKISSGHHGYMPNSFAWSDFFTPSKLVFLGGDCSLDDSVSPYHTDKCCIGDFSRPKYRSCACMFDGVKESWDYTGNNRAPSAGFINGHARIYGDDQEIFDDRYIGEQCQPWVLNEKFFSGLGTIVVGAAVRHENPFVQLFNFWGSKDTDMGNTVLSVFDPPSVKGMSFGGKGIPGGNCMWAMSAARAGVRRNRRGGEMDGERMYQVTYDASCDAHNLAVNNLHYYRKSVGWQKSSAVPDDVDPKIVAGCVCDGNAEKFRTEWNLCEQDWDATLLPLRYAGQGAEGVGTEGCTWKASADVSGGEAATDIGNRNPLNPSNPSASWQPLDGSASPPRLDSLLPDGASRLRLEAILKQNKIL